MATEGAAGRSKNTGRVNPCQPAIQVLPWEMQDDIYIYKKPKDSAEEECILNRGRSGLQQENCLKENEFLMRGIFFLQESRFFRKYD